MKTLETSFQLFRIAEDGAAFEPIKQVNGISGNYMQFEYMEDREDGTFPRVSDYIRLANRIDRDGTSEYLTWISSKKSKKLKSDNGYCLIERTSKHDNKATITFHEPIKYVFGHIGGEQVVREVKQVKGEFTHEWAWLRNGRQDKIANCIEIYFDIQEILS